MNFYLSLQNFLILILWNIIYLINLFLISNYNIVYIIVRMQHITKVHQFFIDISTSSELQSYPLVSKFVAEVVSIGFS